MGTRASLYLTTSDRRRLSASSLVSSQTSRPSVSSAVTPVMDCGPVLPSVSPLIIRKVRSSGSIFMHSNTSQTALAALETPGPTPAAPKSWVANQSQHPSGQMNAASQKLRDVGAWVEQSSRAAVQQILPRPRSTSLPSYRRSSVAPSLEAVTDVEEGSQATQSPSVLLSPEPTTPGGTPVTVPPRSSSRRIRRITSPDVDSTWTFGRQRSATVGAVPCARTSVSEDSTSASRLSKVFSSRKSKKPIQSGGGDTESAAKALDNGILSARSRDAAIDHSAAYSMHSIDSLCKEPLAVRPKQERQRITLDPSRRKRVPLAHWSESQSESSVLYLVGDLPSDASDSDDDVPLALLPPSSSASNSSRR